MDRWTYRDANGVAHIKAGFCEEVAVMGAAQVLAAYEDIGLTPEELTERESRNLPTERFVARSLVAQERTRQLALWGDEAGNSWDRWAVILTEEVGEVCKAIQDEGVDAIRREAAQVAAVACAIVEATLRGKSHGTQD